ncbi:hypothetical protein DBB36_12510 [Flavobacterium sp. WLB]|nr:MULTISPECIES: hypothetical protein [Flavobacterium]KOP35756.1 hypothetical protein AKO67_23535 [Flavobacterium sp. VMW]OWU92070.1 hypothetical protein APR43_02215 [Flavobacterium sp. NLM]PUU69651.1 hypothetical protein DBB36_12510 [Flavobacterium sp. WLB]UUF13817.1 hypothetical protein NLJ00_21395 [Flavobacterium panici]
MGNKKSLFIMIFLDFNTGSFEKNIIPDLMSISECDAKPIGILNIPITVIMSIPNFTISMRFAMPFLLNKFI